VLFSDRGLSDGFRKMHGFGGHTFKWVNSNNEVFFVKFHFLADLGFQCLYDTPEDKIKVLNPDYSSKDLFDHLRSGKSASWTFSVQIMPEAEAANYKWNIFDVTKVWPHGDYPCIPVGKMVLNRNQENFFAETEQSAFSPGHLVPGIEVTQDKVLQGRLFSYPDTHRHRLGVNYLQIPINCPFRANIANGQRDGLMTVNGNQGSRPNYEPNSIGGPIADAKYKDIGFKVTGLAQRYAPNHPNCDFAQPGALFRKVMTPVRREIF